MAKRYFEYKDAKSKKFWEVSVSGKKVNIRYGKIGTDGQTSLKELGTPAEAKAHAEKQAAGKVKKGYKEAKVKAVKKVVKKKTIKKKTTKKVTKKVAKKKATKKRKVAKKKPAKKKKKVFSGQGYSYDSKERKLVEMHAMKKAENHYKKKRFSVEDTSSNHPYDLEISKKNQIESLESLSNIF